VKGAGGISLLDVLFTTAILVTLGAVAVPLTSHAVEAVRAMTAARYVEARIAAARLEAVKRSASVALRFEFIDGDYRFTTYLDGNDNGIRTADIRSGIDRALTPGERLSDNFAGVRFALMPGVPDLEGGRTGSPDGVRVGSARILTLSPDGTATSGTLYLHGRRDQYAIRVLGATGRTRVLHFHAGAHEWMAR
jgi:hypothetical protein